MVLIKFLLETFFKLFLKRPIWTSTVRVSISVLLSQTRSKSCLREKTCRGADIKKYSNLYSIGPRLIFDPSYDTVWRAISIFMVLSGKV